MRFRKAYLFRFLSGHGGDFFITLACGCSTTFLKSFSYDGELEDRIDEFKETGLAYGCNTGGKLIESTWDQYKKQIQDDIDYQKGRKHLQNMEYPNIAFTTHYEQNKVDIKSNLEEWLNISVTEVNLLPTTEQSWSWVDYHWNYRVTEDIGVNGIDHIDLLLNDRNKLYEHIENIGENINWNYVDKWMNAYTERKIKPFLENGS